MPSTLSLTHSINHENYNALHDSHLPTTRPLILILSLTRARTDTHTHKSTHIGSQFSVILITLK